MGAVHLSSPRSARSERSRTTGRRELLLQTFAYADGMARARREGMRGQAPGSNATDAAIAEIARMLGALPVVLPASGSCAPLSPNDLSFKKHEAAVAAPVIAHERLQTFPDIEPPLALPPPPPSAGAIMLLAPIPPGSAVPWSSDEPAPKRRWAWVLDAMIVLATAALVVLRSPLAQHPVVHPYAEAATVKAVHGWQLATSAVEHGVANVAERMR